MINTYFIIVAILIIFIVLNNYLIIRENYDTYFIPFSSNKESLLSKFYSNKDYNKNFFKHKMIYDEIYIYSSGNGYLFFDKFNSDLIQSSRIVKSNLIKLDNYEDNISNLSKNKNSITNITLPIYLKNINHDSRLISNLHDIYLICLTKLKNKLYNITNIPSDYKIGILNNKNTIYYFYEKLFNDLNIKYKKSNIIIYNSTDDLFNGLMNDEVKIILYFTELPNNNLNNLINEDYMNELIILPFDLNNKLKNLFFVKNDYSKITYFDLNKLTDSYLPKKFDKYYYFTYKPTIELLTIKEILICNKDININLIKDIFKFIFIHKDKFNNTSFKISKIEPSYDLIKYIPYHSGVLEKFREFGYITNNNSYNCKYFVGKKECTNKVLENNGLN